MHFFAGVFGADCPMCDGEGNETPDDSTTDKPTMEEGTTEEPTTKEPKLTVPVVKNVEKFSNGFCCKRRSSKYLRRFIQGLKTRI